MVVNVEWGSFDNTLKVLPQTIYDKMLDADSVNPGIQMFEKLISGMFLGEILRLVLVSTIKAPNVALFKDDNSSQNDFKTTTIIDETSPLYTQWAVDSSILSIAEADSFPSLPMLRQEIEKSLGVSSASIDDAKFVKEVAHAIAKRAARLSGIAVGAIVIHTGRLETGASSNPGPASANDILQDVKNLNIKDAASATINKLADTAGLAVNEEEIVDIGVDGSLVEFYPGFEDCMRESLRALPQIGVVGERRIRIGIAKDGSGVGAALIALVAAKMEKKNNYADDLRSKLLSVSEEEKAVMNV
jgi:hexokinase